MLFHVKQTTLSFYVYELFMRDFKFCICNNRLLVKRNCLSVSRETSLQTFNKSYMTVFGQHLPYSTEQCTNISVSRETAKNRRQNFLPANHCCFT